MIINSLIHDETDWNQEAEKVVVFEATCYKREQPMKIKNVIFKQKKSSQKH